MDERLIRAIALAVPLLPALAFVLLGGVMLVHRAPSERVIARVVLSAVGLSALGSVTCAVGMRSLDLATLEVPAFTWFHVGHHAFEVSFFLDAISLEMMVLATTLAFLAARFSVTYLHREPGFARFFLLLTLFCAGILVLVMAGSLDVLFIGWELVGITSVLLVGFFQDRDGPVRASLRVYATYRFCDIGVLVGVILMHHYAGTTELARVFARGPWPEHAPSVPTHAATAIVLALLVGSLGKGALFPVGNWLARAMEGPTPSSALFYGAISIHAGVYLMLRMAPLLERSPVACAALVAVGALTAIYGTMTWRVQTDVKSALAFATMTQIGVMFVEIGLGLFELAAVHLAAHASLRALQMLRAPSALRDADLVRTVLAADPVAHVPAPWRRLSPRVHARVYRLALERFHLDALLVRALVDPLYFVAHRLARVEQALVTGLAAGKAVEADEAEIVEPIA